MNVPWHQDNAYMSEEAWNNLTVVAWIPLVDATEQNGCMQVIRQGHRSGRTAKHTCCQGGTWYVEMDEEDASQKLYVDMQNDVVTCPMPAGSVLLMNAHSESLCQKLLMACEFAVASNHHAETTQHVQHDSRLTLFTCRV